MPRPKATKKEKNKKQSTKLAGRSTLKKSTYKPFQKHISGKPRPRPGKTGLRRGGRAPTEDQLAASSRRITEIRRKRNLFRQKARFVRTYGRAPIDEDEFENFCQSIATESNPEKREKSNSKVTQKSSQKNKSQPNPKQTKPKKVSRKKPKHQVEFLDLAEELANLSEEDNETNEDRESNEDQENNKSTQEHRQATCQVGGGLDRKRNWSPPLDDDSASSERSETTRNFQIGGSQYWHSSDESESDPSSYQPSTRLQVKKKTFRSQSPSHSNSPRSHSNSPRSHHSEEPVKIGLSEKMTDKHIELSVQLLQQYDPKHQMSKPKLINFLQIKQEESDDLFLIETLGFLIESLENVEEQLNSYTCHRRSQEKKLRVKVKKLDPEMFQARISLDLDPDEKRKPDPNDSVFCERKKYYSGRRREYKRPNKDEEKQLLARFKAKKIDPKQKKKYKLYQL